MHLNSLTNSTLLESSKKCENFDYAIFAEEFVHRVMVRIAIQRLQYCKNIMPHHLEFYVNLKDCPQGYQLKSNKACECDPALNSYGIKCLDNYLLEVPHQTWLGDLSGGIVALNECQYCRTKGEQKISNITEDSDELCNFNRTGIACGMCVENYSLRLGSYQCADCTGDTFRGVLLLIAVMILGILLVILLLIINLTVSTGLINGFIFYSNIIYLNIDNMLPINRDDGNSTNM